MFLRRIYLKKNLILSFTSILITKSARLRQFYLLINVISTNKFHVNPGSIRYDHLEETISNKSKSDKLLDTVTFCHQILIFNNIYSVMIDDCVLCVISFI
jgi:hypothetical protein